MGSVINRNNISFMTVGFASIKKEKELVCGYYVVPYPVGFISIQKVFFLPVNAQYSVLAQGYVNDASAPILELLGQYFEKSKYLRPEDYPKILEKIKQTIDLLEGA